MNQYKKLMSNTMIFAIGTFSSKLLVFFMTRFYTAYLASADYGMIDVITSIANVMIPIASLCIPQAVIRYGLEKTENKHEVFSIGVFTILIGFVITIPFFPLVDFTQGASSLPVYTLIIYIYVLTASLQSLCSNFIRARGYVKLYATDGIFRTAIIILLNILFLAQLRWGILGYIIAIIASDLLSTICLSIIGRLPRFLHLHALNRNTWKRMLEYAIPLIPTQICVWVFSASDRIFIQHMVGLEANGLYALANKLPTILVLVSGIFIDAWQISTINDNSHKEQVDFFSKVGNVYQSLVFVMASAVILVSKPAIYILAGQASYFDAWKYVPLLIFGSAFACLSNFQNSIYTLHKKTSYSFLTAVIGATLNLILNYLMIPSMGANGAALATLISYIAMFLIRAVHSRKYLIVRWNIARFGATFFLLCIQSALMLHNGPYWLTQQIAFFLLISFLGSKEILVGVKKVLHRRA